MFDLYTPVEKLYLIGPARAKILTKLGIVCLGDLINYLPRYHQDMTKTSKITEVKFDELVSIRAKTKTIKTFRTRFKRMAITQALIEDGSGSMLCVWYNQPFMMRAIKTGEEYLFFGKAVANKGKLILQNPVFEIAKEEQIHTGRIIPYYPLTSGISQKQLRTIIKTYLDKVTIPEYLPKQILTQENLAGINQAIKNFHFPPDHKTLFSARQRLAFDEIFLTQLKVFSYKKNRELTKAIPIQHKELLESRIKTLPYELTESQKTALEEIILDLSKNVQANRLLEGDVGSGKTLVAALCMWLAAKNNLQSVLLCPTEVLAQQHYSTFCGLFERDDVSLGLLTSSNCKIDGNPCTKQTLASNIKNGKIGIIIGTHALLYQPEMFLSLGLVVIDEQHRFGVEQRSVLQEMGPAHLLSMTATPIPRTLALTIYGDLDISRITQAPKGRKPVRTKLVAEEAREETYNFIRSEIDSGRQVFVVCPLIEESDKLGVKSATAEFDKLKSDVFKDCAIGLLHGKLKPQEKESVMKDFSENKIQILVSTSVIEVGVDVPNATVMIIEGAERFGLAQLHQFRGRVGRSEFQSYCFLFSEDPNISSNPRLQAMEQSNNGFKLAEKDLIIRGGGDIYGTQQSGYGFKVATLSNLEAVERSKKYAQDMLNIDPGLAKYPLLKTKIVQGGVVHLE